MTVKIGMIGSAEPASASVSPVCSIQARRVSADRPFWLSVASTSSIVRPGRSTRVATSNSAIGMTPRMS